jgi:hypothetical protein
MSRMSEKLEEQVQRRETLLRRQQIALRRARAVGGDAAMTMIEELETRLLTVRESYLGIDSSDFPNKVVATLAALQGQEREVRVQLGMWKNAAQVKKDIDTELQKCEEEIEKLRKALEPVL